MRPFGVRPRLKRGRKTGSVPADLKLQIDGLVPPDKLFHRGVLFEALYASFPKDPEVKVCAIGSSSHDAGDL